VDSVQVALALRSALARLELHTVQAFLKSGQVELNIPGIGCVVVRLERK
jgi:proline racemase